MWVKQYLNMGANRPKWAFMMDKIFRIKQPKKTKETYQMIKNWNPLTQGWAPKMKSTSIPKRILDALRLSKKYGVELEALDPKNEARHEMPVWLHCKANQDVAQLYKTDGAKCLKRRHRTHYMKQLVDMTENIPENHRETNFCTCEACKKASDIGCTHPNRCFEAARMLMGGLAPIWRPRNQETQGYKNARPLATTRANPSDGVVVDTNREATDLRESIRIFTKRETLLSATALQETQDEALRNAELMVYTDGSCVNNGTEEARAGSGIWYGNNNPRNTTI